ncbi:trypsin-like serine peptidase [Rhizobium leguminosarum]
MRLLGACPKVPESPEARVVRLDERLKQIAPHGLLTKPNGEKMPVDKLRAALVRRISAFADSSDTVAYAAAEQVVQSGIKTVRFVTEGGGSLVDANSTAIFQAEAVIDAIRRVSWYVENGDYVVRIRPLDDGLDGFWRDTFETERARVRTVCANVAAIMIDGVPVGTGWVVAHNMLITNAHVAFNLCYRKPGLSPSDPRDRWRLASGRTFAAAFRYEHHNIEKASEHNHVPIVDVLHVETSQRPDLAVFRIAPPPQLAMPKPLGLNLASDKRRDWMPDIKIYLVGHPIKDLQGDTANVEMSFDGPLDGTKRFSPGKVISKIDTDTLAHDCSTTNGSSGSPIVAMGDVAPVALHYFGRPGVRNEAVLFSAWATHPAIRAIETNQW